MAFGFEYKSDDIKNFNLQDFVDLKNIGSVYKVTTGLSKCQSAFLNDIKILEISH